jgi:DNA helicase-2/ATP-dependent DNA helicase PcrA
LPPTSFERLNPGHAVPPIRQALSPGNGWRAGPLLIIAGAEPVRPNTLSPGRPVVLAGADPQRIPLLTFTRRAAQETIRVHRCRRCSLRERGITTRA